MNCPKCGAFILKDGSMMHRNQRFLCVGGHSFWWGSQQYSEFESKIMKALRRAV